MFYGDPATGAEYEFQLAPGDSLPSNIHSINSDANGELYVLGIRDLGNSEYDGWVVSLLPEPTAPLVTQLLVGSSNWSQGFADVLGSTAGFYSAPTDDDQLKAVPWSIDEVRIVFSDEHALGLRGQYRICLYGTSGGNCVTAGQSPKTIYLKFWRLNQCRICPPPHHILISAPLMASKVARTVRANFWSVA